MPIKPIDLQTLFSQLNHVGRQQAAEKDGAALHANLHNTMVRRLEDEAAKAVQKMQDEQPESESIKDRNGSGTREQDQPRKHKDEPEETPPPDRETIRDPALGGHVDISG